MDKIALSGLVLVFMSALTLAEVKPAFRHIYLGYISPFQFLKGFEANAGNYLYHPFARAKRSINPYGYYPSTQNYNTHPAPHPAPHPMDDSHAMHDSMPYAYNPMYNYGYRPMSYHPYNMFGFPMPGFNPMRYDPNYGNYGYYGPKPAHDMRPRTVYQPMMSGYNPPPMPNLFGDDFMKMMGFDFNKVNNHNTPPHNDKMGNSYSHDQMTNAGSGKGKDYDMTYSYSNSMGMDYTNGKGHMVTKDSSYKNVNGEVEMHDNPAQHFTWYGDGKPVPDNSHH